MSGDIPMIHGYEERYGDEENRLHVQQRITTRCPSCGHQTLFIGSGGHLTCSWLECKEPGLERAIAKLTSPPAPSGWQQRIAAALTAKATHGVLQGPWNDQKREPAILLQDAIGAVVELLTCGQNAKDALPPAPDIERAIARLTALRDTLRSTPVPGIEATLDGVIDDLTCAPRAGEQDPITAAVDAQLDPLKDELIKAGHKLTKETR